MPTVTELEQQLRNAEAAYNDCVESVQRTAGRPGGAGFPRDAFAKCEPLHDTMQRIRSELDQARATAGAAGASRSGPRGGSGSEPLNQSEASQELYNRIMNDIADLSSADAAMAAMGAFGQVVQDIKEQLSKGQRIDGTQAQRNAVSAMAAAHPDIRKMMGLDIRAALRESGDRMTPEERDYWEGLDDALSDPVEWYNSVLRSRPA